MLHVLFFCLASRAETVSCCRDSVRMELQALHTIDTFLPAMY